ncbi:hypothetical protein [Pseudonocardia yunnanensis]|uniref:Uncharacterized protein n=1 Tax=Pseudonocardia yunnanensis TaxID=58107 RepID=A0ABW4F2G7_9PSEU
MNVSAFGASMADRGGGISGTSKAGPELLMLMWADEGRPSFVRPAVAARKTSQLFARPRAGALR